MEIRLLEAHEVDCRVGQIGHRKNNEPWCTLLLYMDARAAYKLLDETFGVFGWKCHYEEISNSLFCTIEVYDKETKQWVCKQNVGVESNMDKEKGEASDALKRAAVAVGVGRELYEAPAVYVNLRPDEIYTNQKSGRENVSTKFRVSEIGYDNNRNINKLVIVDQYNIPRYTKGVDDVQPQPQPQSQSQPQPKQPTITAAIKKAIASCKKREELVAIWNNNQPLQSDVKFLGLIQARTAEINKSKKTA